MYDRAPSGELVQRRGAGGLIGAVEPALAKLGGTWIAAALTDGDRDVAKLGAAGRTEGSYRLRLLDLPRDVHSLHYDVVSNEKLWFLFHYLFDTPVRPVFDSRFEEAWEAYRSVNELYADAVIETGRADAVLVQDYQLLLVGRQLRRRSRARRPLLYFHHTPWCEPDYFSLLPDAVRDEILTAVLSYDVVGFHARRWSNAFLACCDRFLAGARIDDDSVSWKGRSTRVLAAPVPLDIDHLTQAVADPRCAEWVTDHESSRHGRKLIVRVDRIDLSKNPLRGFLAYEELLGRRKALARDVVFLALLYPSRLNVESYQRYYNECLGVVDRINERFDPKGKRPPIQLNFEDDYHRSLAALRTYDALLVNPVFDGLNLVAKEGTYVNERNGSLILSRNAGVHEELGDAALTINPFDVTATADAIEHAIDLGEAPRRRTARALKRLVGRSSPMEWMNAQLTAAGVTN